MATSGDPVVEVEAIDAFTIDENGLPFQEETMEDLPARVTYIDYLKSPVIGLLVGQGDEQALLTAHQALLVQSPWFADACARFGDEVSVSLLCLAFLLASIYSMQVENEKRKAWPNALMADNCYRRGGST